MNREWKNADFRIAFAKNKTHTYALYTLTIKDIYGALPMENKFLEYHHKRDIFSTTIEYIKHFPIHFALIDAYISADGPFGIFADKNPNIPKRSSAAKTSSPPIGSGRPRWGWTPWSAIT